jgi:hypothetical protein
LNVNVSVGSLNQRRWQPGFATDTPIRLIPLTWIMAALALSIVAVAILMREAVLGVFLSRKLEMLAIVGVLFMAAIMYQYRSPRDEWQRKLRDGTESFSLFIVICVVGALSTYPAAAASKGYSDEYLQRADLFLQFHWLDWYAFIAEHPAVQWCERAAYQCIFVTPALLLGFFAHTGRKAEARRLLAAFWLAAAITVLLFVFMPAQGPLAYLWHRPIPYLPETALDQAQLIPALRAHRLHLVDLGSLRGLVAAPSFHAASAVLYTLAALPHRRIRWLAVLVNSAMLLATPVEGTHYLVDLIAGMAVALGSFAMVSALTQLSNDPEQPLGSFS